MRDTADSRLAARRINRFAARWRRKRGRAGGANEDGLLANSKPNPKVIERLAEFFRRNGYVRRASPVRRKKEKARYKKGDEVRLVADSRKELAEIRRLLRAAGFRRRSPFAKGRQWRQPVYGVAEVARFLAMIGEVDAGETPSSARSAR